METDFIQLPRHAAAFGNVLWQTLDDLEQAIGEELRPLGESAECVRRLVSHPWLVEQVNATATENSAITCSKWYKAVERKDKIIKLKKCFALPEQFSDVHRTYIFGSLVFLKTFHDFIQKCLDTSFAVKILASENGVIEPSFLKVAGRFFLISIERIYLVLLLLTRASLGGISPIKQRSCGSLITCFNPSNVGSAFIQRLAFAT